MSLILKSFNQILGDEIRKCMAINGLSDLNKGSVLMTLLEASAQEIFSQYASLIRILDNFSIDNLSGIDLDNKAKEFNLERFSATLSSGFVAITDSSFTKVSTTVYVGATPPVAGDTVINVADASGFPTGAPFGSLYIGRNTVNLEGPINLSAAPTNYVTYWSIPIAAPLAKNHNLGETVILTQGGTRAIAAGTMTNTPASNVSPAISFRVVNSTTLADGESVINNILVSATTPGSSGNVALNSITQFSSVPFNGATVTNTSAFSNGRDLETDQELRDRIKDTIQSLSKGTALAITSGIVGIVDTSENKRVASASLIEPISVTDIARLYIDDGTGFEPSFAGKGSEDVLLDAVGTEQFLQLGNYPLVKAQVESINESPYVLANGDTLIVEVNNLQETITFSTNDFDNISIATAVEVAEAINNKATLIDARTSNGHKNVVITAKVITNETIQVIGGTTNLLLAFPTDLIYTLKFYKNDILLSKDGETAFLESDGIDSWLAFTSPYTLNVQIDDSPMQYIEIQDADILVSYDNTNWTSLPTPTTFTDLGKTYITASVIDWAIILQQAIAGASVTANGNQIRITSNVEDSSISKVYVLGGSLATTQGWPSALSQGKMSEYTLNRFSGQIELATPLVAHDNVTVSTPNTRANIVGIPNTIFDLTPLVGRDPQIIISVDGVSAIKTVNAVAGDVINVTNPGGAVHRYTNATTVTAFANMVVGDYVFIANRTVPPAWVGSQNTGIFRIVDCAASYFEVVNPNGAIVAGGILSSSLDIQAFSSDVPPQSIVFTAGSILPADVAIELNSKIIGATATVTTDNEIQITTNSYEYGVGSIQVVIVAGNAINLGLPSDRSVNMAPHYASLLSEDQLGFRVPGQPKQISETSGMDIVVPYTTITDTSKHFALPMTQPGQWLKFISQFEVGTVNHDSENCVNKNIKSTIDSIFSTSVVTLRNYTTHGLNDKGILNTIPVGARYQQFYPYDFDLDNLVVIMDNDPSNKTYNIPLYRSGKISASTGVNDFDAIDTDSNITASFGGALWTGYDFSDYKVWMQSRRPIDPTGANNGIIFRSVKFGPIGDAIRLSVIYPDVASSALDVSHTSSGSLIRSTTQDGTTVFTITTAGDTTTYTRIGGTSPGFNNASVGDLVYFNSTSFNILNNGWRRIIKVLSASAIVVSQAGKAETPVTLSSAGAMVVYANIGTITVTISLGSGAARATTQDSSTQFDITLPGGGVTRYTFDGTGTNPGFNTVSVGDIVTFNSPNFNVLNNGTFKISAKDGANMWIEIIGIGFAENNKTLGIDDAMSIYPLSGNTANAIVAFINNNSPINQILSAVNGTGETGAGTWAYSSLDDALIASQYVYFVDGENWVSTFASASPQFLLKKALAFTTVGTIYNIINAPNTDGTFGEKIKLIPTTAKNVVDHFNKPTITALSSNATITRANEGDKVQITSKLIGSQGRVNVTSGVGNANLALIQGSSSIDNASIQVAINSSDVSGFHTGQLIKITNPLEVPRQNDFDAVTQVSVSSVNSLVQRYTLGERIIGVTPGDTITISQSADLVGSTIWKVARAAGTVDFRYCSVGDELQTSITSAFDAGTTGVNSGNIGVFPIVYIEPATPATYVYIINPWGVAEAGIVLAANDLKVAIPFFTQWKLQSTLTTGISVEYLSQGVFRYRWTSLAPSPKFISSGMKLEDYIVIDGSQFSAGNRGTFKIIGLSEMAVEVYNPNGVEESVVLGESLISSALVGVNVTVTVVGLTANANAVTFTLASGNWLHTPKAHDIVTFGAPFNALNQGNFEVISATSTAITVFTEIAGGTAEVVAVNAAMVTNTKYENSLRAYSIDSALINDKLFVASFTGAGWFDINNQGTLTISDFGRVAAVNSHYLDVNSTTVQVETITLGAFIDSFYVIGSDLYESYQRITNIAIDSSDVSKTFIYFANDYNNPIGNSNRIALSFDSQLNSLNKLGFSIVPEVGIDGYKYWTGLLRTVQRKVDGYGADPITYPGLKAAGVQVDVMPPMLQQISIGVDVRTVTGVPLSMITNAVKSTILAYISSLGVGQDVILSQIVKKVQEVPGIVSVTITDPSPVGSIAPERIIIADGEKAISFEANIIVA